MPDHFTVDEANLTLPLVRRIVTDIVAAHAERVQRIKDYGDLDHDLSEMNRRRRELDAKLRGLTARINGYIEELEEIGCIFKGFEPGLVDFPSKLDGRDIFLCWKLDEGMVEYWHEIEAGFAGRQKLPEHLVSPAAEENQKDR